MAWNNIGAKTPEVRTVFMIMAAASLAGAVLGVLLAHIGVLPKMIEITIRLGGSVYTIEMPPWALGAIIFFFINIVFEMFSVY